MIRKLENTFTALIASAALLAVGLMLAQPVAFPATGPGVSATVAVATPAAHSPGRVDALAEAAALTAELATVAALASTMGSDAAATASMDPEPRRKARKGKRHRRQALVMPYFSFAPRG